MVNKLGPKRGLLAIHAILELRSPFPSPFKEVHYCSAYGKIISTITLPDTNLKSNLIEHESDLIESKRDLIRNERDLIEH